MNRNQWNEIGASAAAEDIREGNNPADVNDPDDAAAVLDYVGLSDDGENTVACGLTGAQLDVAREAVLEGYAEEVRRNVQSEKCRAAGGIMDRDTLATMIVGLGDEEFAQWVRTHPESAASDIWASCERGDWMLLLTWRAAGVPQRHRLMTVVAHAYATLAVTEWEKLGGAPTLAAIVSDAEVGNLSGALERSFAAQSKAWELLGSGATSEYAYCAAASVYSYVRCAASVAFTDVPGLDVVYYACSTVMWAVGSTGRLPPSEGCCDLIRSNIPWSIVENALTNASVP